MKAPLSWLKDYVEIDCSVSELASKLFSCGFEVEDIEYVGKNIKNIVTCKILSIEKHPNADKLSVTKVDAGKYGELQIVTSAKNIFKGAIVPVAIDGAVLNNGETIKTGELRGVKSEGMFCSGEELGINDDWYKGASVNGILILTEDYPLGESVTDLLEINDVIFDINVTANRPDCQSIIGIAREVSAVLNKPFKMPDLSFKVDKNVSTLNTISVKDCAYDLCPRYISRYIKDIKIEESPLWMKRRLFAMGIRSINNIVDITNFVLTEIGQPMHAFDLTDLSGSQIIIRRANDGEKIVTLDEKEFELNSENLVICDSEKPVALAGVMGGINSGIKDTTKNVVFECATFKRDSIRKTSRQLGQRSDSSSRYEKGVDLYSVETGMKRALSLIDKLGCGTISCDQYDLFENQPTEKVIATTVSKVNAVLGIDVPAEEIKNILLRLNFRVQLNGDDLVVTCPLYREDMESYPDIAEEVIREYGYSNIKPTLLKTSEITAGGLTEKQQKVNAVKELLTGFGFNEMISYSFVSEKEFDLYGLDKTKTIKILNPISEDMAVMRTSLIPSVVRAVSYNLNRKNNQGRLFELAKTYTPKTLPLNELPVETDKLAFATFGAEEDFFTLKGVVESLLNLTCFGCDVRYSVSNKKYLHPTRSADIVLDGKVYGSFGQLAPVLSEELGIDKEVYVCEIDYAELTEKFNDKVMFTPISKFPTVERDLAVVVDDGVSCGQIIDVIKKAGGKFLESVNLFDVYKGVNIPENKKSMAYNLIFGSLERTLNVDEIEQAVKNILDELSKELNAELR